MQLNNQRFECDSVHSLTHPHALYTPCTYVNKNNKKIKINKIKKNICVCVSA